MNLTTYKKFKGDRLMPWGKPLSSRAQKDMFLCLATRPLLRTTTLLPGQSPCHVDSSVWCGRLGRISAEIVYAFDRKRRDETSA